MQSPRPIPPRKSRDILDTRLCAYSAAGKAAVAIGAAIGGGGVAHGQSIVNLVNLANSGAVLSQTTEAITPIGVVGAAATSTHGGAVLKLWTHATASAGFLATAQMNFVAYQKNYTSSGNRYARGRAGIQPVGHFYLAADGVNGLLRNLGPNAPVNGQAFASGSHALFATLNSAPGVVGTFPAGNKTAGHFALNATGYVGFQMKHSGNSYFGWLRIRLDGSNGRPSGFTFVPDGNGVYGQWNSSPNGLISTPSAIPEPATVATGLALFALGAVGVREFRKRRQAAA